MSGSVHASAFRLLDELCATNHIAPGLPGTIFRIVDDLQATGAPDEELRLAERISVALIRLQYAARDGQDERRNALMEQIRALRDEWRTSPADNLVAA